MTAQHHIIKETSDTIGQFLTNTFKDAGYKRVHIIVKPPKPDEVEGKLPAISLYLYNVKPDGNEEGLYGRTVYSQVKDESGDFIEVERPAPIWLKLEYLLSTWAQTPEDEQLLMGLAVRSLVDTPAIERERLKGDSFADLEEDFSLLLRVEGRMDEGTLSRFWSSLNQPLRPALSLWTMVPVLSSLAFPFRRVEERIIGYHRLGVRKGEREIGPAGNLDLPPTGTFRKRTE